MSTVRCCLPLCLPQTTFEHELGQVCRGGRQRSERCPWCLLQVVKLGGSQVPAGPIALSCTQSVAVAFKVQRFRV
jgi:hypothetical protein